MKIIIMVAYKFYLFFTKLIFCALIASIIAYLTYTAYHQYILYNGRLSHDRYLEITKRMGERKEHVKKKCSALGLSNSSHKASTSEYLINRQYHIIWCPIFKAASTPWLYNFNLMANYSATYLRKNREIPVELARKKYPRPTEEIIKEAQADSLSFLIVRHPLERLASAFKDKVAYSWPQSYYHNKIMQAIRKIQDRRKDRVMYPLFEEFIYYITDKTLRPHNLDEHWVPYTDFCTPCKFDFDIILKFETLDEDQRYLVQMAKLPDYISLEKWNDGKKHNTLHTVNNLYASLKKRHLDELYNLYKNDFLIFNYTMDNYYNLIWDKSSS